MNILLWTAFITGGFLSGSVMYCKFIPKLITHKDVCELSDDGNPGAFNVFTHCGVWVGCLCLLLDVLKGFVPVLLASLFMDANNLAFALVMFAPALGHAVGMFNRFHGGKCIAVSFGIMFGIMPVSWIGLATLALLFIFFFAIVKIKDHRICSIVVYSLFLVLTSVIFNVLRLHSLALGSGLIAAVALFRHIKLPSAVKEEI